MSNVSIDNRTIFRILLVITAFIFLIWLAFLVRRELAWIGAAFFLAVALDPAVTYLARRLPRRSRGLATTTVFLAFIAVTGFIGFSLFPPLVSQTQQLARTVPGYVAEVRSSNNALGEFVRATHLVEKVKASQEQILSGATGAGGSVVGVVKNVFSGLAATFTILASTFFMLLEGPRWMQRFWSLQHPARRKHYQVLANNMYRAVTGYVTGNLLTSLIAAVLTAALLSILGVPYAIPLGLVVGILDLLPLIGASLGAAIVLVVAFFTSLSAGIIALIFFALYQQVENHILQPIVYGRTIQMSPLLVTVAAVLGAALGGILGAFVAIPIAASIKILVVHYIDNKGPELI